MGDSLVSGQMVHGSLTAHTGQHSPREILIQSPESLSASAIQFASLLFATDHTAGQTSVAAALHEWREDQAINQV